MRSTVLVVALLSATLLLAAPTAWADYAPGCTVSFSPGASSVFRDIAFQPDGKIVAAGYVDSGIERNFLVARFQPDLTLDTTFNGVGYVVVDFDADDEAHGVAVQTDGKIVAVGYGENNGGSKRYLAIMRLLPDGTLDPAFVGGGGILYDFSGGSSYEELRAVALQRDGKIVVAGYHTGTGVQDILVGRFLKDGNWDTSFDLDGAAQPILPGTSTALASDVVVEPSGKIVVAATATFSGDNDFVVLRYRTDGTFDPAFGSNAGWEATDAGNFDDNVSSLTLDAMGRAVLAGTSSDDIALVRYRTDGNLDGPFGSGGVAIHDIGTDAGNAIAFEPSGSVVVVGRGGGPDFALTRFDTNGSNTLSVSHDVFIDDEAFAIRIRKDGKLVVGGSSQGPGSPRATLALFNPDGSQDCDELVLHPFGDGSIDYAPVGACGTNWECVNDNGDAPIGAPSFDDGSGSYVISASAPAEDLYRLDDGHLPPGKVVHEIEVFAVMARSGAGVEPQAALAYQRQGFDASPVVGPPNAVPSTFFGSSWTQIWSDLNWTAAELDALEIGVEHVSGDDLLVTQLYVTVRYRARRIEPVDAFTASATGVGGGGQVSLNWLNPSYGLYDETVIRRSTTACPMAPSSDDPVVNQADGLAQPGTFIDSVPVGPTYYYAAFVEDAENHASVRKCLEAKPFDRTANQVDWIYSTSDPIAALATPGVRITTNVVYTSTNDGVVHAMVGGDGGLGGGSWPVGWRPFRLGAPAPNRPPIVQLPTGVWVALFGAEDGHVYAVNSANGALVWRSPRLGEMLASSPAAILTAFGGSRDLVFIGTRNAGKPNQFYALNGADGTVAWQFKNGGAPTEIGMITSGPAVSYADERVYFTSYSAGSLKTVWCLDFASGSPLQCPGWGDFGVSTTAGGHVDASPILSNGLIFVSDKSPGENLDAITTGGGVVDLIQFLGGGGARSYVFPRFGTMEVFASTSSEVFSIDTVAKTFPWTPVAISSPSAPLSVINTDDVYVGGGDGKLHRLSAASGGPGTTECIGDCSTTMVGSPGYDFMKQMIYLGTDEGNVYGVKTPF